MGSSPHRWALVEGLLDLLHVSLSPTDTHKQLVGVACEIALYRYFGVANFEMIGCLIGKWVNWMP